MTEKSELDPQGERLSALLTNQAFLDDKIFTPAANRHLTVMMTETGAFKKVPTAGVEELVFKSVRYGKKKTAIFVFESAAAAPYDYAEIELKDVASVLPGFGDWLIDYAADKGCTQDTMSHAHDFLVEHAKKLADESAEERRAQEAAQAAQDYANNDLFGIF